MTAVRDLMTPVSSLAHADDPLVDVVATMRANNHSCAIVTRHGLVTGVLTERDLVVAFSHALTRGALEDLKVSDVMSPDPVCVSVDASLFDALTLARTNRIRHLPVINDCGQLVGIVTHTDMVNVYVDILEQQTALVNANNELRAQSREDPLLKIGNRRAMEGDLAKVAAIAHRTQQNYAITLLDLDYFKSFNDYYGHVQGDQALQAVVTSIKKTMRNGDSLYRYGGEELLMLMPGSDLHGASHAAERARQEVQALGLRHQQSPYGVLTISAGTASTMAADTEFLITAADRALYQAKAKGRNKVCAESEFEAISYPFIDLLDSPH